MMLFEYNKKDSGRSLQRIRSEWHLSCAWEKKIHVTVKWL